MSQVWNNAIEAVIPANAEPIRSPVPMRRFRYDAKHDTLICPRGKMLKEGRAVKHGRFFTSRAVDLSAVRSGATLPLEGRVNRAVVLADDYLALLRARRRRERWSDEEAYLTAAAVNDSEFTSTAILQWTD